MSKEDNHSIKTGTPQFSSKELRSGEKLSDLIHKIGHDIGNPLTSIISFASIIERFELLESGPEGAQKQKNYAGSIVSEAWRVGSLAERLVLLLSSRDGTPTTCDVIETLEQAEQKIKSRLGISSLRLTIDALAPQCDVHADPEQLLALITELLLNAAGANSEKDIQPVNVTIEPTDTQVTVIISNTIDNPIKTELNRLFEPYVTEPEDNGKIGLGLTVSHAIVERLKGSISLREIDLDKHINFSVTMDLPASIQQFVTKKNISTSEGEVIGAVSILIIEDEPVVASAMEKIINFTYNDKCNLEINIVSGTQALTLLENDETFDVILCDLNLAGTNGRVIFEAISSHFPENKKGFVFLTGDKSRKETQTYLSSTGCPYLHKPFETDELVSIIDKILKCR